MRHWKSQGILPLVSVVLFIRTGDIHSPVSTSPRGSQPHAAPPGHRAVWLSPLSDLAGDDSPDTTLLLYYCPWSIRTKSVPCQGSASPSQLTSKRKLQGFIGAATESSLEKATIKALRFNVTCLIEPLEAQRCIKFPYNYVLREKETWSPSPAREISPVQKHWSSVLCCTHTLKIIFLHIHFFFP